MSKSKQRRIEKAQREAADRRRKALVSLAHCLGRSDVMRIHHDVLVHEILAAGGIEHFTEIKRHRFAAYVCFWFAGLATVVERYQQLAGNGTIPPSARLGELISTDFLDLLKPFRNAVAHCSDHDDARVLDLLANPDTIPDRATDIAHAFKEYLGENGIAQDDASD